MKKILSLVMACLLLICCASCERGYDSEKSNDVYPIALTNDLSSFFESLNEYKNSYDEDLMLSNVIVWYDSNYQASHMLIDYGRLTPFNGAVTLNLTYDIPKQSITYTDFSNGSRKALQPGECNLNTSRWKIGLEQGLEKVKQELSRRNITSFAKISCHCFSYKWNYIVLFGDTYSGAIYITIDPTSDQIKLM